MLITLLIASAVIIVLAIRQAWPNNRLIAVVLVVLFLLAFFFVFMAFVERTEAGIGYFIIGTSVTAFADLMAILCLWLAVLRKKVGPRDIIGDTK
jgi:drug/metabolite transporter (DMT)-like permease